MTADEPVAGVPRLCARRADCTRPRGHDDDCGPDRADTELADLRAEVERLREELADAREDAEAVRSDLANAADSCEQEEARAEKAEDERDDALARLAEAEGVARTNAAWVQQQYSAAKEAREQRDALQRQVDAVRAMADEIAKEAEDADIVISTPRLYKQSVARLIRAALDAVEPADQPHPTPDPVQAARDASDAALAAATDGKVPSLLSRSARADQPHPTPEADEACPISDGEIEAAIQRIIDRNRAAERQDEAGS